MNRKQILEAIKKNIPCTDYLLAAPNHRGESGYCCPFCYSGTHGNESTGAVQYYPKTNTWHCFACGKTGDVIDLYITNCGADYNEALEDLGGRLGLTEDTGKNIPLPAQETPQDSAGAPQNADNRENDNCTNEEVKNAENGTQGAADFSEYYKTCAESLQRSIPALSYLSARGIDRQTAARFSIGFDPEADPASAPGAAAGERKPHPAPRIIIPCSTSHFVARSIDPETPGQFKALNPNTTKGGGAVALFNAAAIRELEPGVIFITEGVFDALSLLAAGWQAIATNSKGNGKLIIDALQKCHNRVTNWQPKKFIVVPDNDDNPKTAADTTKRAHDLADAINNAGSMATVYNVAGKYHDANDAWRENPDAFLENIRTAIDYLNADDLTLFLDKVTTEAYKPHATGLAWFDDLLDGGIMNQSLLTLLAAPSTGKTTIAQQIAESIAENGRPMVYINLEMSREQMIAKALSARLYRQGVRMKAAEILQGYAWTPEQRSTVQRAIAEYRRDQLPRMKYNPDGVTNELHSVLNYLEDAGEKAKAAGEPAPGVVIDYLHLLTGGAGIDLQELIKKSVKGLKDYCIKNDSFVILISATNRDSNKRGQITDSSGRDSSGIEYTGDYILSLNYEAVDSGNVKPTDNAEMDRIKAETPRSMILRVHKNRMGAIGKSVPLDYDPRYNVFDKLYTQEREIDTGGDGQIILTL